MDATGGSLAGAGPFQLNNSIPSSSNAGFSNTPFKASLDPPVNPILTKGLFEQPVGDTNAAAFLAAQVKPKTEPNPLPISTLRTGFCYDIRMRFHQTVDYRDTHPEDPRRIYRIYKELALAGLLEDRETQSVSQDELMLRLRARYATEEEVLLVHSTEHLAEMQATESNSFENRKLIQKCPRKNYYSLVEMNSGRCISITSHINALC